nr:immunoglobulin heavy chain junction region [Mus musculus]MBK4197727.1 immunoglobulin heavy chain junction region [Mus musculus]MBK4197728.1 immunoglobulin heavy chain junction region [Mus musculus]MBK4197729.1 immunoglobulin heavy chain junction region [Mus musculus]
CARGGYYYGSPWYFDVW